MGSCLVSGRRRRQPKSGYLLTRSPSTMARRPNAGTRGPLALGLALVGIAVTACSSSAEDNLVVPLPSSTLTSLVAENTANEETGFEAVKVIPSTDAPTWCANVLDPNVVSLPAAMIALTDPTSRSEVEAVLDGAAEVLESSLPEAGTSTLSAASTLANALRAIDIAEPSAKQVDDLIAALDNFGSEADACGYQQLEQ